VLRQFPFVWPELTATLMLSVVRWLMAMVVIGGLLWWVWPRITQMTQIKSAKSA
jgi:hypothetical protein